jgi:glycosyltransferase involved in cell wall biosynthesis
MKAQSLDMLSETVGEQLQDAPPLVSVIIPCYNQGKYLGEAIESILAQTYRHFEIIVIDDGSTDETGEVAGRYEGVRCVRQENRGLSGARNRGIEESRGELMVFVDADDRLKRGGLEAGVKAMREHADCSLVFGHYENIMQDGSLTLPPRLCAESEHYLELLRLNFIGMHATVMYRRSVLDKVGGFDTSLRACEDYDIYFRIAREHKIVCHHELVAEYRQHPAQMSRDPILMLKSVKAVFNSQKRFIKGDRQYEEAYNSGVRYWQEHLISRIAHFKSAREWGPMARGMIFLLLHNPRRFGTALVKQVRRRINIFQANAHAGLYRLRRQATRNAALKERLLYKELWARGINDEVSWWQHWLLTEEGAKWKREVQNSHRALQDHLITDRIKTIAQDSISILDVGAGPVTNLGYTYPGKSVAITAIDPLAKQYRRILRSASISAPVKTVPCHGEQLLDRYAAESFDFVYACNSLDHSYDPLLVIKNMLALTKKNGFVVFRHYKNEAKTGDYDGLHQWNFDIKQNDLIIWNEQREHNLREIIGAGFEIECQYEESSGYGGFQWSDWVVCVITKSQHAA